MSSISQLPLSYGMDAVQQMLQYNSILRDQQPSTNGQAATKLDFDHLLSLASSRDPPPDKKFSISNLLNQSKSIGGQSPVATQTLLGLPTQTATDNNVPVPPVTSADLNNSLANLWPQLLLAAAQQQVYAMRANCSMDINGNVSPQSVFDHSNPTSTGLSFPMSDSLINDHDSSVGERSPRNSLSSSGSCRKSRTVYDEHQIKVLEHWFFTRAHYIVGDDRIRLAQHLQLSESQVRIWFQNRRSKWRKENPKNTGGVNPSALIMTSPCT